MCFCGGGACFCHSGFCGVRFDGPSQAMEALQPTRTHNYTHIRRRTHLTDRQTSSGLGIFALCVPSSAVCSRSFSLSLCFDVACVCRQHACAIISARRRSVPIVFADGKVPRALFSAGGGPVFTHSKVQKRRAPSEFLAKWILNAN